jgi:ABC-type sugar transport system permease subunit
VIIFHIFVMFHNYIYLLNLEQSFFLNFFVPLMFTIFFIHVGPICGIILLLLLSLASRRHHIIVGAYVEFL